MSESTIVIFFVIFVVLPCAISGYLIAVKQRRGLIFGWNDDSFINPKKAATVIGHILILLSVIILIYSILYAFELLPKYLLNFFFMIIIALPIGSQVYIHKKYGVK